MSNVEQIITEEVVPGKRLGRHVWHDEASKGFMAGTAALKTTLHRHYYSVFNQGDLGSCTGNASTQCLMTAPFYKTGRRLTEKTAIAVYERATALDPFPGQYPPEDTGSTGLAVAKALVEKGYIKGYAHAFGLQNTLGTLVLAPCIAGINWYDSFDEPDAHGNVSLTPNSQVRGGHEICLVGIDVENKTIRILNSWGKGWGDKGFFNISWDDFGRLLDEQGDVTVFRV